MSPAPVPGGSVRRARRNKQPCRGKWHNGPLHISLPPGEHKFICDQCGEEVVITIAGPTW